jgi:hypothetical protein
MKLAIPLLLVLLAAAPLRAADPVYLDQLIETPAATLETQFGPMKREGCFAIAPDRFLLVTMDKKEHRPWRVVLSSIEPCKKPVAGPALDLRERNGVNIGDTSVSVVTLLGRPDAAAPPDASMKKLGESEYFYICRVSEGCARHTSVLIRDGIVTAISEWYSQ